MAQLAVKPLPGMDDDALVAEAFLNACEQLSLNKTQQAAILRTSLATASRLPGRGRIEVQSAMGERALMFLRIYRSLLSLLGNRPDQCAMWLKAYNEHLSATPIEMIHTIQGMVHVADYLDAMRGV